MADEMEWLAEHSLSPGQCTGVDCYWRMGDEVVLLHVGSHRSGWNMEPGLYARWVPGDPPMLYLVAVVEQEQVSRPTFEGAMAEFHAVHQARGLFRKGYIGKRLRKLGSG